MEDLVVIPLYEDGRWRDHNLPRAAAKEAIASMITQMDDEHLEWLAQKLTAHQLVELAAAVEAERLQRAQSRNPETTDHSRLKLFGG